MQDGLARSLGPLMLSVLRIVTALLFFFHGSQKILNFPPTESQPEMFTLVWFAGILEVVGGALLIIGLKTRAVAFLMSGMMAVAYFMVHAPNSLYPIENRGELAILYCFNFFALFILGGGPLSVDSLLAMFRSKPAAPAPTQAPSAAKSA